MHKLKITTLMVVITLFSIFNSSDLFANVFAHNVRITQPTSGFPFDGTFSDGSGAGIRFTLSDKADTVHISIYNSSMELVSSISAFDLSMGDNIVVWDGMDSNGSVVADGKYSISIYTASAGYDEYTVLYNEETEIYTRGVTSMKAQSAKGFGFTYSASGGGYAYGVARHSNNMAFWGNTPGDANLTVAYTDSISKVGSDNLRFSSEADKAGYVYLARRSGTVPAIYRYHVDTLAISIVDSGGYNGKPQGIAIGGVGNTQQIIVSNNLGQVFAFINDGTTQAHDKNLVLDDSTTIFWDITTGAKEGWLYATYQAKDTSFLSGVAAFDFTTYNGTPFTLADAAWTVEAPDTATAGTITYSEVDGQLYCTFARRPHAPLVQGIYTVSDLEGTPTISSVYPDPEDNMTQYRADVAIDAAGNIIFFENSNEFITLISPPTGHNSYLFTDNFTSIDVSPSESVADVRVDEDNDGVPDRLDEVVTVKGVVTSYSFSAENTIPVTLQDETGAIYLYGLYEEGSYNLGDILQVTGTVAHYKGLTELKIATSEDIQVIGQTKPLEPMELTVLEWLSNPEKYESMLIKIKGLAKVNGDWPEAGMNSNLIVTDGVQEFTMRIDKDLDLANYPEPTFPIDLTGVTSQYTSNPPFDNGYQILPRMYADIDTNVAAAPNSNYALLTPEDGARIVIDSISSITANWNAAADVNGDALLYQWFAVDPNYTSLASGALNDTSYTFTGTTLYDVLGTTFDSVTVNWSVRCTEAEGGLTFVTSIDTFSVTFINGLVVGLKDETIPHRFYVDQNYPNPFNPSTTINFGLPTTSEVSLVIYDVLGREVATLIGNKSLKAGTHSYEFNAAKLASGTYIYRLTTNNNVVTKKMLLLK